MAGVGVAHTLLKKEEKDNNIPAQPIFDHPI